MPLSLSTRVPGAKPGKHASLAFTEFPHLDPYRFIGTQTPATVTLLTAGGPSEPPYDSQPPTITCQSHSTLAGKVNV